jgi:hypothetical protein
MHRLVRRLERLEAAMGPAKKEPELDLSELTEDDLRFLLQMNELAIEQITPEQGRRVTELMTKACRDPDLMRQLTASGGA